MKHSTTTPTKAQEARMEALSKMRCVACEMWGAAADAGRVEVHHLVDKGTRKLSGGHDSTIPLCVYHHRGVLKRGWVSLEMEETFGPSMQRTKRKFIAVFGTERDLLALVNKELKRIEDERAKDLR